MAIGNPLSKGMAGDVLASFPGHMGGGKFGPVYWYASHLVAQISNSTPVKRMCTTALGTLDNGHENRCIYHCHVLPYDFMRCITPSIIPFCARIVLAL